MGSYSPSQIEKKWQKVWQEKGFNQAIGLGSTGPEKPKYYALVEFPYPSGAGLHVGHVRAWSAMDAYVRKKRMEGYNVLFPMGWDAFGLPAENYAIKKGVHPSITTAENIANFKRQIQSLGLSFDWSREINTTDPKYYRWTQWIFLKLLENGLAYQKDVPVNWCPSCRTNLADEEVMPNGTHERCGQPTEKRQQKQWLLRITKYADRLIEDLKYADFPDKVSRQQVNWIGRSEGVQIEFKIKGSDEKITIFTTAPDTICGVTFVVISPELIKELIHFVPGSNQDSVSKYVTESLSKSDEQRADEGREKTGVETGIISVNPLTGDELPVYVADYVLFGYGTGAIMAVPGHDGRDRDFARKFNLPIKYVVKPSNEIKDLANVEEGGFWEYSEIKSKYSAHAFIYNSLPQYNGQLSDVIKARVIEDLERAGIGKRVVTYHLHDWIFSRQHYWGEPIPVVHCEKCGVVPVPEKDLPVELPYVERYEPSGTGESPLATMVSWVNTSCPKCGGSARRETDTMPNWAGSNWYFVRYLDPQNEKELAGQKLMETWLPVDVYEGGYEHTTLHLLYSRFIYKFLHDIKVVPTPEPYASRRVHGIVLGPDNRKMSKSFGNVLNPDEIIEKFGADTLRLYEMFIGPFAETVTWNMNGVAGVYRFLGRVFALFEKYVQTNGTSSGSSAAALLAKLSRKVSSDLDAMKFNTAVAALMEFINDLSDRDLQMTKGDWDNFLRILAPMVPHLAEELYQILHEEGAVSGTVLFVSVHEKPWPNRELEDVNEDVHIVVTVNGKKRDVLDLNRSEALIQSLVQEKAAGSGKVNKYLEGLNYRVIFVPGDSIHFVTS